MQGESRTVVFDSTALIERGLGLRFPLPELGEFATGFVVRYDGKPYAYVNQCAHVSVEMDWNEGEFFNTNKQYFVCATHGAVYRPDNGYCIAGPCKGKRLSALAVREQDGQVIVTITL